MPKSIYSKIPLLAKKIPITKGGEHNSTLTKAFDELLKFYDLHEDQENFWALLALNLVVDHVPAFSKKDGKGRPKTADKEAGARSAFLSQVEESYSKNSDDFAIKRLIKKWEQGNLSNPFGDLSKNPRTLRKQLMLARRERWEINKLMYSPIKRKAKLKKI